jgi:hypothetical protein
MVIVDLLTRLIGAEGARLLRGLPEPPTESEAS